MILIQPCHTKREHCHYSLHHSLKDCCLFLLLSAIARHHNIFSSLNFSLSFPRLNLQILYKLLQRGQIIEIYIYFKSIDLNPSNLFERQKKMNVRMFTSDSNPSLPILTHMRVSCLFLFHSSRVLNLIPTFLFCSLQFHMSISHPFLPFFLFFSYFFIRFSRSSENSRFSCFQFFPSLSLFFFSLRFNFFERKIQNRH